MSISTTIDQPCWTLLDCFAAKKLSQGEVGDIPPSLSRDRVIRNYSRNMKSNTDHRRDLHYYSHLSLQEWTVDIKTTCDTYVLCFYFAFQNATQFTNQGPPWPVDPNFQSHCFWKTPSGSPQSTIQECDMTRPVTGI